MNAQQLRPDTTTRRRRRALTLIEVAVIILILLLLGAYAVIRAQNRRFCNSPRLRCAANLSGIGKMCKIYANDYGDAWPMPAFDESAIGQVDYTIAVGGGLGTPQSPNRRQPSVSGPDGTRQLSVTRAFSLLVRSGDVTLKQLICPGSNDTPDETEDVFECWDFAGPANISYGFQVPFGPPLTRAGEWMDSRVVLAADKGPYSNAGVLAPATSIEVVQSTRSGRRLGVPADWVPFNSANHGGEGQNVLFADSHVEFVQTPTVGADYDNIYTAASDNGTPASYRYGLSPWTGAPHPFAPINPDGTPRASTDSLIFP